jgi:hypothetical protein
MPALPGGEIDSAFQFAALKQLSLWNTNRLGTLDQDSRAELFGNASDEYRYCFSIPVPFNDTRHLRFH